MSLYSPINTALQNLNRQLNINANRDAARAKAGLQSMLALNDMQLANRAAARADKQLALEEDAFTLQQKQARREQQLFEQQAAQRQVAEQTAQQVLAPKPIDLRAIGLTNEGLDFIEQNPEATARMADVFGENARYDPDTNQMFDVKTGKPIMRNELQMRKIMPQLYGLREAYADPQLIRESKAHKIQTQLDKIKEAKKEFQPNDPRTKTKLARLRAQEKALQGELNRTLNVTPQQLIDELTQKKKRLTRFAAYTESIGGPTQVMRDSLELTNKRLLELQKMQASGGGSTQQRFARNPVTGESRLLNTPKGFSGVGMQPATIDPNLKGWVWDNQYDDMTKEMSSAEMKLWKPIRNQIWKNFSEKDAAGQFFVPKKNQDMEMMAQQIAAQAIKEGAATGANASELINASTAVARDLYQRYLNDLAAIEQQNKSDEEKAELAQLAYQAMQEDLQSIIQPSEE